MGNFASEAWPAIIKAAAASPFGIGALAMLVAAVVVIVLFGPATTSSAGARLVAIGLLLLFCAGLSLAALYTAQPTVPSAEASPSRPETSPSPPAKPQVPKTPSAKPPTTPPAKPPIAKAPAPAPTRRDCGTAWTAWVDVGDVGSEALHACRVGCVRGQELAKAFRVVGFPPSPEVRFKFQCWQQ